MPGVPGWTCPVCGGHGWRRAFRASTVGTELGADAHRFRPASADFGSTAGEVVRCLRCGHGSVRDGPAADAVSLAYAEAADASSLEEEHGQVETARRDLRAVGRELGATERGRLLDVGCWTGSLVLAAGEAGWAAEGIEPSTWAVDRARQRGLQVRRAELGPADGLEDGAYQVVTCCDVLEHLAEPRVAVERMGQLLRPGGILFVTVPDAGSRLARLLGARWWSVLPMHLQYFTRGSLDRLLSDHGFEVVAVVTHPKLFSRRYYAERFGQFVPIIGRPLAAGVERLSSAAKLVGPDFRDRMAVVARQRRATPGHARA